MRKRRLSQAQQEPVLIYAVAVHVERLVKVATSGTVPLPGAPAPRSKPKQSCPARPSEQQTFTEEKSPGIKSVPSLVRSLGDFLCAVCLFFHND